MKLQSANFADLENISIDLALVTAVRVERDKMLRYFNPLDGESSVLKVPWGPNTYFIGKCGLYRVALVLCDPGSGGRNAATLAKRRRDLVLMVEGNGTVRVTRLAGKSGGWAPRDDDRRGKIQPHRGTRALSGQTTRWPRSSARHCRSSC